MNKLFDRTKSREGAQTIKKPGEMLYFLKLKEHLTWPYFSTLLLVYSLLRKKDFYV